MKAYVPRRGGAGSAQRQLRAAAGRLRGLAGPAERALRRRDAGAAGPRQLLPLGLLQQRAGKEGGGFGLCVRRPGAGKAGGRAGIESRVKTGEGSPAVASGASSGGTGLYLRERQAPP